MDQQRAQHLHSTFAPLPMQLICSLGIYKAHRCVAGGRRLTCKSPEELKLQSLTHSLLSGQRRAQGDHLSLTHREGVLNATFLSLPEDAWSNNF